MPSTLQQLLQSGALTPGSVTPQRQVTLEELQQMFGRKPKLVEQREFAGAEHAPSGVAFLGGASFPVDERAALLQNGLQLGTEVNKLLRGGEGKKETPIPPGATAKSDAAGYDHLSSYIDSVFQAELAQQTAQLQAENAQRAAAAKLQLGSHQTGQQRETETAQARFEAEQAQAEAEAKAQQEAASAGPFQVQVPPNSALAQRPVAAKDPLSQLPSAFDAAMMGGGGNGLQQRAQAAAPGNAPGGGLLGGLPTNTGPTRQTTQMGIHGQVIPEGPFGYQVTGVPSFSQQVAPNELGPEEILAVRQQEVAQQIAAARAKVVDQQNRSQLYASTLNDLAREYGEVAPATTLNALARAIAMGDDEEAARLAATLPKTPSKKNGAAYQDSILQRQLLTLRAKNAETTLGTIDTQIDAASRNAKITRDAIAALEKGLSTEPIPGGAVGETIAREARRLKNPEGVAAFEKAASGEILDALPALKGQISDNDLKFLEKTAVGFGKGNKSNLDALRRRLDILEGVTGRVQTQRERAVSDINSINEEAGLGTTLSPVQQRERTDLQQPAPQQNAQSEQSVLEQLRSGAIDRATARRMIEEIRRGR